MMKLLSPSAIKEARGQDVARDLLRAKEIEEVITDLNKNLNKAQADFALTLANQRDRWAKEEEDFTKRKREMENEINDLEAKKLNALIPVGVITKGAEDKMAEAVNYLAELKERERFNEELTEKLEDKLTEVGDREIVVKKEETKIIFQKEGIERQKQTIIQGTENLSKEIQDFVLRCRITEKELDDRKTAIFLKETTINTKEDKLRRLEKSLSEREIRLADERGTLDRAWAEVRRLSP